MKKAVLSLAILASALVIACSTMTTAVDYDHGIDWSRYHTFTMAEGTKAPTEFVQKRIENAIISALNARGLQLVTSNPDLLVYPHVVLTHEKQWNAQSVGGYYGYGYNGWAGGGGMTTVTSTTIPIGTLIVDLVDARNKDCVWRGTAQDEVTGKGEDRGKAQEAANKLFENFPPGSGK